MKGPRRALSSDYFWSQLSLELLDLAFDILHALNEHLDIHAGFNIRRFWYCRLPALRTTRLLGITDGVNCACWTFHKCSSFCLFALWAFAAAGHEPDGVFSLGSLRLILILVSGMFHDGLSSCYPWSFLRVFRHLHSMTSGQKSGYLLW